MQNKLTLMSQKSVYTILGFALFFYLALRAIYTPILHDEIATFYYYIQTGIYFPPDAHWDANNHILNSLLSNWSFQVFGHEPWALRLPNVLSFIMFYIYSWKLVQNIQNLALKWTSFLALVMCHYIFEYFGETRGYGLSMAFMVMGFYFTLDYFKTQKFAWSLAAMLSIFLAVSANLTIIYIYLMVLALLCLAILKQTKKFKKKLLEFGSLMVFAGIIVVPLIHFSLELKSRGALYYGGKTSFIDFTVSTLSYLILGSKHPAVLGLIIFLSLLVIFILMRSLLLNRLQFIKVLLNENSFYAVLFLGSLTSIFATRYLLDVNFPEDRTALYLYPLLILSLAFSCNNLVWKSSVILNILSILFAYIPSYFIVKVDLSQASFSMEERAPQAFFDHIEGASHEFTFKPTVGGYTTQNLCWYFMNFQAGGAQNSMLFSSYPDTLCDYQILNIKTKLPKNFDKNYKQISKIPINDLHLYQRKKAFKRRLIIEKNAITNWTHQQDEYFNLLEYEVSAKDNKHPVLLEISGVMHAPNSPFYSKLIISQKDKNWNEISQEGFTFNWLRYHWNDDQQRFNQVLMLPYLSENAHYIQVFIWNIQGKPYLVKDVDLKVFGLE